jgi:hypothetical protein
VGCTLVSKTSALQLVAKGSLTVTVSPPVPMLVPVTVICHSSGAVDSSRLGVWVLSKHLRVSPSPAQTSLLMSKEVTGPVVQLQGGTGRNCHPCYA